MKTKTFFSMLMVIILLTIIVTSVLAMAPGSPVAEDIPPDQTLPTAVVLLASLLAGRVGVPLVNWLKLKLMWINEADKPKNVWLTFGVSCALAIIVLLATNTFLPITAPSVIVSALTTIFTTATLIYKSISQPEPIA